MIGRLGDPAPEEGAFLPGRARVRLANAERRRHRHPSTVAVPPRRRVARAHHRVRRRRLVGRDNGVVTALEEPLLRHSRVKRLKIELLGHAGGVASGVPQPSTGGRPRSGGTRTRRPPLRRGGIGVEQLCDVGGEQAGRGTPAVSVPDHENDPYSSGRRCWSGRQDSNPRPSPWQSHGCRPTGQPRSVEQVRLLRFVRPIRRERSPTAHVVQRVKQSTNHRRPAFPDSHGSPSRPGLSGTTYGPIVDALSIRGAARWTAEAGPGAAGESVVSRTPP